jgi:hypothetical protein
MKSLHFRILFFAAAAFLALGTIPAFAQAPLEPAQLPSRTVFYLIWRGAPAPDVRKANALMALWDDADFAPVRSALASNILSSSQEQSPSQKLTPEELQEYASLLENGFTLGYLAEPAKRSAAGAPVSKDAKPPAWNGMFFVYDRTGKESLIAKAILRMRAQEKDAPALTPLVIGGVPVLKVERKNGATYWADQGKFAVSAGERSVMEQILGRLNGKSSAAVSLAQSSAYQEALPILGSGVLEFFVGIPDLKELASDSSAGGFKARPLLEAARLEAIHSIGGHLALEGSKTHMQAAIFGDPAPGTPFDIWPANPAIPVSLAFAPADAVSYSAGQINFMGIYSIMKRIAQAAFPQGQQGNADMFDTLAAARIGMPLADALSLPTGEFASMQTSPSLDTAKQVYFLGIRKKPETLKLMRAVFSDQLTSERNEGDTTFLKISLGGKQGVAGVAQWNFFNLAVTPDMMIGATRAETLREVLANRSKGPAAAGLATVPQFQTGRAKFAENLNSISYFDFQKVDWTALRDRVVAESRKASAAKSLEPMKKPVTSGGTNLDWLTQVNVQVFARHLHYSTGVSWKDSKGIHWDQWLE